MIGAAVGGAALSVGVAVAATSPAFVPAPHVASAPAPLDELGPAPAQVKGYTILRPSSLVMDTPSGLRILLGTGLAVTGPPDLEALLERARAHVDRSPAPPAHGRAAPPSPAAGQPAPAPAAPVEPDFPGRGEEHRSDKAEPKRSERAEQQAHRLPDEPDRGNDERGKRG